MSATAERYARHIVLKEVGGAGQQALSKARVAIVGIGGLGCPLAQYLTAAGVGTLALIDDDKIETHNLQRQILFCENDVGKPKAETAAAHLRKLNSDCEIIAYPLRLTSETADILKTYDIIADASDNFKTRFLLSDITQTQNKTLVSGACARFDGQVAVFKAGSNNPSYRDFAPDSLTETNDNDCSELGIIGAAAGVVGSLQALEIIKEITGAGESLAGSLLIYEGLRSQTRRVKLNKIK